MTTKTKRVMDIYFRVAESYSIRNETLQGDEYIVVPVTLMVEGVHSGSHGAVYHSADELGKIVESWNGIPVTIGHPQVNGQYASANSPAVLTEWSVGTVFNAYMDGDALKAEAWILKENIEALSPELLQRINDREQIEVSVGVFSDEETVEGIWNTETYDSIARNHRPDHLALLSDEVGACSIDDGCGIRVNKRVMTEKKLIVNDENQLKVFKELNRSKFTINATGFTELSYKAMNALDAKDGNGFSYYLEEMFDNELIFHERNYSANTSKYYKQTYQENAAGEIELTGEAVQVKREITYPLVPQTNGEVVKSKRTKFNNMSEEKCTECVKEAANVLIANKATSYAETDRKWLETLSEEQLEKMTPVKVEKTPEIKANKVQTMEEYLKTVPTEVREQVETGLRVNAEQRTAMVIAITANETSVFSKEDLEAMPMETLKKVYKMADVEKEEGAGIYINTNGNGNAEEETVEVMSPVGVEFETVKN